MTEYGEPWEVCESGNDGSSRVILASDSATVCRSLGRNLAERDAAARRVAACVNFLAGVPTEALLALLDHEQRYLRTHGDQQANQAGYDPFPTKGTPAGECRDHIRRWHELNPCLWEKADGP